MELEDGKDQKHSKGRFARKLFGKEKHIQTDADVSAFLHGPSDKLYMTTPSPTSAFTPRALGRIDTTTTRRWPSAAEINNSWRNRSASPKRSRKGLVVRFSDAQPEVIGEGGDEAESPTADISRRRAATHPQDRQPKLPLSSSGHGEEWADRNGTPREPLEPSDSYNAPSPGLRRVQTGGEAIKSTQPISARDESNALSYRDRDHQESFGNTMLPPAAAKIEAEMRASEGKAFIRAVSGQFDRIDPERTQSFGSTNSTDLISLPLDELQINTMKNAHLASASGLPPSLSPGRPHTPVITRESNTIATEEISSPLSRSAVRNSGSMVDSPPFITRAPTLNLQEAAVAVGDEALHEFSTRTAHLFTLFRLSAEALRPLSDCSLEELVRAASWWLLKGRMELERTIREKTSTPEVQQTNHFKRQQAYTDLAKAFWLADRITSKSPELQNQHSNGQNTDTLEARQAVISGLRKLTMSMKRNSFLPPEEKNPSLPRGLDTSVWVQDDGNKSLVSLQKPNSTIVLSEAFPLGDSTHSYVYGRLFADTFLMEDGESQNYHCTCLLSIARSRHEKGLKLFIANQEGTLIMCVQEERSRGPTWEDVSWSSSNNTLDLRLPRGFKLRLNCNSHDFRNLVGIYEFQQKIRATMVPGQDEEAVFETTVKSFQCFDQDPHAFPAEPLTKCQVKLFEKIIIQKAATGPRRMHRGFRTALITGPNTKNLRGLNQELLPGIAIQFGFLRGDGGYPALLLKVDEGKTKPKMVFTFEDVAERTRFHALLIGSVLGREEMVFSEIQIKSFGVATGQGGGLNRLNALDWQNLRVINSDAHDTQSTKTVLSEQLRVIMEFKTGSLTDRFNIGPGELKFRLDISALNELRLWRQPQEDMTIVVSQQTAVQSPHVFTETLQAVAKTETVRTYVFPSLQDLHSFQAAMTGFVVLFDGRAASFNISRRRMVVPIYKKWDAATTRLQVVQKEKTVQLVAFFENFSHGDCMGFTLKSTDTFETHNRGGRFSVIIVDAKFAMPKARKEGDAVSDSGFVNLDMPDYPGEHDDITIIFDTAEERDRFAKALPAPTRIASRMGSVRR